MHNGSSFTPEGEARQTREGNAVAQVTSQSVNPNAGEMGEVDASENSIDGMGAIKFTDEEDCGFFGMLLFFKVLTGKRGPESC